MDVPDGLIEKFALGLASAVGAERTWRAFRDGKKAGRSEEKLDTLGEKMDAFSEKVGRKLDGIQSDLTDTKERVARIEGWREGRKEGLSEG